VAMNCTCYIKAVPIPDGRVVLAVNNL
jgi:hypothetical protein